MITTLIEKGWRNRQLKSLNRVSIKWDISIPISSVSLKPWVCSLKVLHKFACSARSSWFLFLNICLIFSSYSSCCLWVTKSRSLLLIIYLGCEKKQNCWSLWWVQILSSLGFLRASSAFCAGELELQGELPSLWGWAISVHCSDPGRVALTVQSHCTRQNISLNRISCVMFLGVQL